MDKIVIPGGTRATSKIPGVNKCAPDRVASKQCGTCFTMAELKKVKAAYEKTTGKKLRGKTKKDLYESITGALSCGSDRCVIDELGMPSDLTKKLKGALVPEAPKEWSENRTEWLSNFDIDAKAKQLLRNRRYVFLGVHPMDFEHVHHGGCVSQNVCQFDVIKSRKNGYSRFVMVLNTDYHTSSGSHWVALAGFVRPSHPSYGIYYYDSTGRRPTKDVDNFVTRVSEDLYREDGQVPPYEYNDRVHQKSNTECGMFCLTFIDMMANLPCGFREVCERMADDKQMIRQRDIYFDIS